MVGMIGSNLKPVFSSKKEVIAMKEQQSEPIEFRAILPRIRNKMNEYMNDFVQNTLVHMEGPQNIDELQNRGFSECSTLSEYEQGVTEALELKYEEARRVDEFDEDTAAFTDVMFNPITGRPAYEKNPVQMERRNRELKRHFDKILPEREAHDSDLASFRRKLGLELPICQFKEKILSTIEANQVTVISGATGCGKTTQVPQFILEHFSRNGQGSCASIIVTQPRRLPAMAIAEQVAYQLGETTVGRSVGYHVRFEKKVPTYDNGAILFCTAGVLLRKLENCPDLDGVSHVLVDEVHERDVIVDLLLILLKRLVEKNANLKVVLMSASINAQQFVDYFGPETPVIDVPGRCYPVECHYLSDILLDMNRRAKDYFPPNATLASNRKVNADLVVDLVGHIDRTQPTDGSILVFLPGWEDIKVVKEQLELGCGKNRHDLLIVPCHSRLPVREQQSIFKKPPGGVRKVVLATNIAETSITVPDVVHVIDPGLCKETRYDKKTDVSTFGTYWVSKANATQRQGRAGRMRAGHCFKLYDEDIESDGTMSEFPTPEILRVPLETVVMSAKLYCPEELAFDFLSEAPQPPDQSALEFAISALKSCNVLADDESLTVLGRRIVPFSLHPRLSVTLVAASMLGVLDPALNLAAVLSAPRSIFVANMSSDKVSDRQAIRGIKEKHADGYLSDHVALARIVEKFEKLSTGRNAMSMHQFSNDSQIHVTSTRNVLDLKALYEKHMMDANFVEFGDTENSSSLAGRFSKSSSLLLGAIVAGFYPNLVVKKIGTVRANNKIVPSGSHMEDLRTGLKVRLVGDSAAKCSRKAEFEDRGPSIYTYFGGFFSESSKQLTLREASSISPMTFFIFAGKRVDRTDVIGEDDGHKENDGQGDTLDDKITVVVDERKEVKFTSSRRDMDLLINWKNILHTFSVWYIVRSTGKPGSELEMATNDQISASLNKFLIITQELLEYEKKCESY